MVCLETTFLVDMLRGKRNIVELQEELEKTEDISIAAPSVMELWRGAILSNATEKEKTKINELISSFAILPLDEKSAKEAGEIETELLKAGSKTETEDVMIAGICRANGEKLVTRDQHYAKISGLKIIKY